MKNYLLALENSYMEISGELVYKKGKKYPIIADLIHSVCIRDEQCNEHWFSKKSDNETHILVLENNLKNKLEKL